MAEAATSSPEPGAADGGSTPGTSQVEHDNSDSSNMKEKASSGVKWGF